MVKKKNESLLLLGTGKIMQKQQSVCVCVLQRKGDRERERHRRETEEQIFLHVYKCSVPNPKFLPMLHTSGKPQCIIFVPQRNLSVVFF